MELVADLEMWAATSPVNPVPFVQGLPGMRRRGSTTCWSPRKR